jgi:N6-L-threonylcarbamoyladenine synthase
VRLPKPLINDGSLNFSFSGLKTAMLQHITRHPVSMPSQAANDLCASFQRTVCDVLVAKTRSALERTNARRLVVAGGVACNSGLRAATLALGKESGVEVSIPKPALCGDNAAMLAVPGNFYLEGGYMSHPSLDVTATWEMDRIKEIFK